MHTGPCLLRTEELAGTELAWHSGDSSYRPADDSLDQGRPLTGWLVKAGTKLINTTHNLSSSFPKHSTFQDGSTVTE